ncbi:aldo/keto reductase [Aidingimonas halophila]|uniref:Aldo/keto reductase n=1 Tax=Aidingimonas halophila TaxID=574349 RepID=A0A1H2UW89_9GAMM|nr:aldo/keto reductase [Aidingimonas halophila]GHC23290.1 aldo/keto reductase [Aidingimonas halophila]SDW60345.1 Aldo/keto reductase [Aidingimonas halophila]
MSICNPSRRTILKGLLTTAAATAIPSWPLSAQDNGPKTRAVPSTGDSLPLIGLGSWITFNVGDDSELLEQCVDVMAAFFDAGGRMIDSSPMYGSSQATIGYGLDKLDAHDRVFSADKLWTSNPDEGRDQIDASRSDWGISRFDLLQVHNLRAWRENLETLLTMKDDGELRYVGITTSHGRRHDEFETIMRDYPLDFVQLTYNPIDRAAEQRLLPLAREREIGVIVNRPFQQGRLIDRLEDHALPDWASDVEAETWAQLILKFIISHPDVTCAIPATTQVAHVRENMAAASSPLPDDDMRQRIAETIGEL